MTEREFEKIWKRHRRGFRTRALAWSRGSREDAEDLMSDALAVVAARLPGLPAQGERGFDFGKWFLYVLRRKAGHRFLRAKREAAQGFSTCSYHTESPAGESVERIALIRRAQETFRQQEAGRMAQSEIREAMYQLTNRERRIVHLVAEGWTLEEVGQAMGLSRARTWQVAKNIQRKVTRPMTDLEIRLAHAREDEELFAKINEEMARRNAEDKELFAKINEEMARCNAEERELREILARQAKEDAEREAERQEWLASFLAERENLTFSDAVEKADTDAISLEERIGIEPAGVAV